MSWKKGRRRNDGAGCVSILRAASACHIGRLLGVSDRTVRRWISGEDHPPLDKIVELIEKLWPQSAGALPLYDSNTAIDGNTRVGGVGEYSVQAACGSLEYLSEVNWSETC